jgi:hypothetical protein
MFNFDSKMILSVNLIYSLWANHLKISVKGKSLTVFDELAKKIMKKLEVKQKRLFV